MEKIQGTIGNVKINKGDEWENIHSPILVTKFDLVMKFGSAF